MGFYQLEKLDLDSNATAVVWGNTISTLIVMWATFFHIDFIVFI